MITAITVIYKKQISFGVFHNRTIFWGISIICFLQACYGLLHFASWLPPNHLKFAITGSFDNPAGFAAVLAMEFPIGLYLLAKAKKDERYLKGLGLSVIAIAVFLSDSRTGILAILVSLISFFLFEAKIIRKFQQLDYYKLLSVLILCILISGASILYYQKKDSAYGRLLIWKVSTEIIKDQPVFGHGYGAFRVKYIST